MDVLNLNKHAVPVKLVTPDGKVDYATVAPSRRVTIPDGYKVNTNWLSQQGSKVKTFTDSKSETPMEIPQAPISDAAAAASKSSAAVKITAVAKAPAPVTNDTKAE